MATKAKSMEILLCDARQDPPLLEIHHLPFHDVQKPTVGWALQILGSLTIKTIQRLAVRGVMEYLVSERIGIAHSMLVTAWSSMHHY